MWEFKKKKQSKSNKLMLSKLQVPWGHNAVYKESKSCTDLESFGNIYHCLEKLRSVEIWSHLT